MRVVGWRRSRASWGCRSTASMPGRRKYGCLDVSQAPGAEAVARGEYGTGAAGGGPDAGPRRVAVGDPKKRLELVAQKAAIEQMRSEYAFGERRACWLILLAVSTYRYCSQREDGALRSMLRELAL